MIRCGLPRLQPRVYPPPVTAHRYRPNRYHLGRYLIVGRDGRYLMDATRVPFTWTDREYKACSFRTRGEALAVIVKNFVGVAAARELLGLRVVRG